MTRYQTSNAGRWLKYLKRVFRRVGFAIHARRLL